MSMAATLQKMQRRKRGHVQADGGCPARVEHPVAPTRLRQHAHRDRRGQVDGAQGNQKSGDPLHEQQGGRLRHQQHGCNDDPCRHETVPEPARWLAGHFRRFGQRGWKRLGAKPRR